MTLIVLKILSPLMGCKLTYDVNMSWERILPLKIYDISKLGNKL